MNKNPCRIELNVMQKSVFGVSRISLVLLFSVKTAVMLMNGFYLLGSKILPAVSLGLNLPTCRSDYSASSRFVTCLHVYLRAAEVSDRLLSTICITSAVFFYALSCKSKIALLHLCITHRSHDANNMHARWNGGAMASATSRHPAANVLVTR